MSFFLNMMTSAKSMLPPTTPDTYSVDLGTDPMDVAKPEERWTQSYSSKVLGFAARNENTNLNQMQRLKRIDTFRLKIKWQNFHYRNYPKFSDRYAWAMSADSDQTLIRVYTVCHSVCIVWMHSSMVEPHSSNFRVITTNCLGVSEYLGNLRYIIVIVTCW